MMVRRTITRSPSSSTLAGHSDIAPSTFSQTQSRPSQRAPRTGKYDIEKGWLCNCDPRLPARKFKVRKDGPNHGRWFWTCRNSLNDVNCNFFLWNEDAATREAAANILFEAECSLNPSLLGMTSDPRSPPPPYKTQPHSQQTDTQTQESRESPQREWTQARPPLPGPRVSLSQIVPETQLSPRRKRHHDSDTDSYDGCTDGDSTPTGSHHDRSWRPSSPALESEDDDMVFVRSPGTRSVASVASTPRKERRTSFHASPSRYEAATGLSTPSSLMSPTSRRRALPAMTSHPDDDSIFTSPVVGSANRENSLFGRLLAAAPLPTPGRLSFAGSEGTRSSMSLNSSVLSTPTKRMPHPAPALWSPARKPDSDIADDVLNVLRQTDTPVSAEAQMMLVGILGTYERQRKGYMKGRDIARQHLRTKNEEIVELKKRIAELEADKALSVAVNSNLRGRVDEMHIEE